MKNIIIPTDFSENARTAMRYATSYFSDSPVCFYMLHVDLSDNENLTSVSSVDAQTRHAADIMGRLKEEINICRSFATNKKHLFFSLLGKKSLIETLRAQINEMEVDYIFMGTKGSSKTQTKGIGSNAYDVITKVKCPTVVIPELARFHSLSNMALPTDFNNWSSNRAFTTLYKTLDAKKVVLHILQTVGKEQRLTAVQKENKEFLLEFVRNINYHIHYLAKATDLDAEIEKYVDALNIDMMAVVGRNLNFIQRLLARPKPAGIHYHLKTPFLVLHE